MVAARRLLNLGRRVGRLHRLDRGAVLGECPVGIAAVQQNVAHQAEIAGHGHSVAALLGDPVHGFDLA